MTALCKGLVSVPIHNVTGCGITQKFGPSKPQKTGIWTTDFILVKNGHSKTHGQPHDHALFAHFRKLTAVSAQIKANCTQETALFLKRMHLNLEFLITSDSCDS